MDTATSTPATPASSLSFLRGGGEMGALMRAHDWSTSSLGSPHTWPQSLRTTVRLMLNTGHPMYIWWGRDGACLYNDAYRESIGPERHPSSLGRPAREVWDEIWDIIGPQIEQVREGRGATWHVNHLVPITRHGRREDVYWTYSYSPIDDEASPNGIGGVLVVCTETTEQVLANKRVAAERDQLGQLFEQSPNFMALLSGPQHRFEIANPSYLRLVGQRPVVGKPVAEALPETLEQGYIGLLDQVYASGEAYIARSARFVFQLEPASPFVERYVDFVYQPIKGRDGSVTGIFVEGADVTDRALADQALRESEARHRELAEQLAQANRTKDEFLATLAHELRNPLAPIRNALALQRRSDEPRVHTFTRDVIERQVLQMVRLIDDLLDVSRLTRGLVELRRAPLVLADTLREVIDNHRASIEEAGHTLAVALTDEPCIVDADETRIVQVCSNLLHNASKFTPKGGRIGVTLRREGEAAVIEFSDTGIGIPPEMTERVFEMFTQVERSHARVGGGLGIGLTLVRQLVERHGGQVRASSAGPGQGSVFSVTLPLGAPAAAPLAEAKRHARPMASGLRIVVADDNVDAATSLALLLEAHGHEVRVAHDGAEALALTQVFRPQAMVLDIAMPHLDGHAVCREVRALPWGREVLMIAASGWGQVHDRSRSEDAGFDHHLVKPVDFEAVDALLAQLRQGARAG